MNKNILIAVVALVVVVGAVWYSKTFTPAQAPVENMPMVSNDNMDTGEAVGNPSPTGGRPGFAMIRGDAVYIAEQRPGKEIIVNVVNLTAPGYVVLHESSDGKPGAIIGHSTLLDVGNAHNVSVELTRAARDGEVLVAMLHSEKGGAGFDPATDLPVQDSEGNIIHMPFEVSAGAPDPATMQIMF